MKDESNVVPGACIGKLLTLLALKSYLNVFR